MFLDTIFQDVGAWEGNFKNSRKRSMIREDVKDHASTVTGNLFNATVAAKKMIKRILSRFWGKFLPLTFLH